MRPLSEDARRLGLDLSIAAGLNGVFLVVAALVLWPMGKAGLVGDLARSLCLFAIVVALTVGASLLIQRLFRIESDPPSNVFVIMNLAVSGALQLGWATYAARAARTFAPGASFWVAATVYAVGFLSSLLSQSVVGAFYRGQLYTMVNVLLAVAGYVVFAVWVFRP
jgi:hypothetical protein